MPVKIGDTLPNVNLYENDPNEIVNLAELSSDKKILIFGIPGAFVPGCSTTHLPGYLDKADEFKSRGIDHIFCVSVNDPYVMKAWAEQNNVNGKIRVLADPSAAFTKALDMGVEVGPLGGIRSIGYSMLVDNGKIEILQLETEDTTLICEQYKPE